MINGSLPECVFNKRVTERRDMDEITRHRRKIKSSMVHGTFSKIFVDRIEEIVERNTRQLLDLVRVGDRKRHLGIRGDGY